MSLGNYTLLEHSPSFSDSLETRSMDLTRRVATPSERTLATIRAGSGGHRGAPSWPTRSFAAASGGEDVQPGSFVAMSAAGSAQFLAKVYYANAVCGGAIVRIEYSATTNRVPCSTDPAQCLQSNVHTADLQGVQASFLNIPGAFLNLERNSGPTWQAAYGRYGIDP
ncbi:hypothetical protein BC830DRAFT_1175706 [Chytriomyces sp. MP71]|nr:hypothetical protein BC830DRAFT_1175706 [Chytriomyces sp. MP71]